MKTELFDFTEFPLPWHAEGRSIRDANGQLVANTETGAKLEDKTAEVIVEIVNAQAQKMAFQRAVIRE